MKWFENSWENLTPNQVHAIIRLRLEVFVVEQDCVYADLDGKDVHSIHLWAEDSESTEGEAASAVVRLVPPGVSYVEPSIGRVATSASQRGTGLGQELMERAVRACQRLWPNHAIRISAQQYLIKFYESFGFEVVGEGYLEDNIPHIGMVRPSYSWGEMIALVSDAASEFETTFRSLDSENQNVPEGGWNKKEVLRHLILSDASLFAYMRMKVKADPKSLPLGDLHSDGRGVHLIKALLSTQRWKTPQDGLLIPPSGADEFVSEEELIDQWNEVRSYGFAEMQGNLMNEPWWAVQVFRHPTVGYLSLVDTLAFMAAHIRHHTHQIHRLQTSKSDSDA